MSEDPNKLTTLAGATFASFALAAVLGIAAFFLFWGLGSAMHGAPTSQRTVVQPVSGAEGLISHTG